MSFTNLGLNLVAMSSVDTWFHLKRAVLRSALNTVDSTIRQNDVILSYPFKLFPSDKLLTWTPQTVVEITSSEDQLPFESDNSEENCDTALESSYRECDHSTIEIELLRSPASSISLDSLSCYSSNSEEEINNDSESSFNSLFEDDSSDNSSIYSKVDTLSPNPTDILLAEGKSSIEPIPLGNRSWNEQINYLATDEEWDEHIDELAKEFEKDMGFDSQTQTECLSFDNTITRISAAFDCDEEVVDDGESDDVFLSPRSFEVEEADQSFNSLFDGEDSIMIELENFNHSQPRTEEFNNVFKMSEEEKQEYQLLSLRRHASAIRRNPHLFHLFR